MRTKNTLDGARRRRRRPKCEQLFRLDIRALSRRGLLRPANNAVLQMESQEADRTAIIGLVVMNESIRLHYAWAGGNDKRLSICCTVQLERTTCRFGGARLWFRCCVRSLRLHPEPRT
jgi:hypothetical protein